MTKTRWMAFMSCLGLIALAAFLLVQVRSSQRLGAPGLRVVPEPTRITGGTVVRNESVLLPADVPQFTSTNMDITPLEANWLPKDTLFGRRIYRGTDGFSAQVSAVLMGTDRTSIHKPQFCLDGQGWRIYKSETITVPISRPYPYDLRAMKLTAGKVLVDTNGQPISATGVYVYWFVADKLLTPHHGERMWWMARELVTTGVLQRWAYVSYWTVCAPGQEDAAFNRMKELIMASVPEFQLTAGTPSRGGHTAALEPEPNGGPDGKGMPTVALLPPSIAGCDAATGYNPAGSIEQLFTLNQRIYLAFH